MFKSIWGDKKILVTLFLLALIVAGVLVLIFYRSDASRVEGSEVKNLEKKYLANQIVVKISNASLGRVRKDIKSPFDTGDVSFNDLNKKYRAKKVEKVFKSGPSDTELDKWYLITFKDDARVVTGDPSDSFVDVEGVEGLKMSTVLEAYSRTAGFDIAEPHNVYDLVQVPNDTYYSTQNIFSGRDDMWGLKKINAEVAWDKTKGSGIVVAVVDTGVDYNHPDLKDNIYRDSSGNLIGYNYVSNNANPMDDHFHGTHVAGTIAAKGNNDNQSAIDSGTRIVGVGWDIKIMPLKGLSAQGGGTTTSLANCLKFAADNGAQVINNSWGGSASSTFDDINRYVYNKNVINIYAAGNSKADVSLYGPAGDPNAITVGASNYLDKRASFSNFGVNMDFVAPGGDAASYGGIDDYILSARLSNSSQIPGTLGPNYAIARGTSMAAPHAAGVAALIKSVYPNYSVEEVRQLMRITSDKVEGIEWSVNMGSGRINVGQALKMATPPPVARIDLPEVLPIANATTNLDISGSVSARSGLKSWNLTVFPQGSTAARLIAEGSLPKTGFLGAIKVSELGSGDFILKLETIDSYNYKAQDYRKIVIDQEMLSGWPKQVNSSSYPIFADINGDGKNEIVYGTDSGYVEARTSSGSLLPGFPVGTSASGALAVYADEVASFDVNRDGRPEIVNITNYAYSSTNPIYPTVRIIDGSGKTLAGWPVSLTGDKYVYTRPTISDINGDGTPEILITGGYLGRLYAFNLNGTPVVGFPRETVPFNPTLDDTLNNSSPAVYDLDGDGKKEVYVGGDDGAIYGFHSDGSPVSGFPVATTRGYIRATLGIADINGDGKKEIMAHHYKKSVSRETVAAYSSTGGFLWEYSISAAGLGVAGVSSFGFVDAVPGGGLEIFVSTGDTSVTGLDGSGKLLPGWPYQAPVGGSVSSTYASPAFVDITGDGKPELLLPCNFNNMTMAALSLEGQVVMSRQYGASFSSSAASADFDGDGFVEIASISSRGMVYIWKTASRAPQNSILWGQYMKDSEHTGTFGTGATTPPPPDTIAPTTTITGPVAGATVSGKVTVTATATDNLAIQRVELFNGNQLVATDFLAPYTYIWDTANIPNGSYVLQTRAYDGAGNVGNSTTVSVKVFNLSEPSDNIDPVVSITSPVAGSSISRKQTVTIAANASDNLGVTRVEFYVNGSVLSTDSTAPYSATWKVPASKKSSYTIQARGYDAAGNIGYSSVITVSVK